MQSRTGSMVTWTSLKKGKTEMAFVRISATLTEDGRDMLQSIAKKENAESMLSSLKKLGATEIKTIPMKLGNKISRIVAWTFLNPTEQKEWK